MPRSGDDARRRLQEAALALFVERGYDETTAAQIARRAGVTERTFFRHFPDKREVLFAGEAELRADLEAGVAAAPSRLRPLTVLRRALSAAVPLIEGNRAFSEPRFAVIAATPVLQERQLAKDAVLKSALAEALEVRGVERRQAVLAAEIAWAAFGEAVAAWVQHPDADLEVLLDRAFGDVHALAR